jgi:hypothetical protein
MLSVHRSKVVAGLLLHKLFFRQAGSGQLELLIGSQKTCFLTHILSSRTMFVAMHSENFREYLLASVALEFSTVNFLVSSAIHSEDIYTIDGEFRQDMFDMARVSFFTFIFFFFPNFFFLLSGVIQLSNAFSHPRKRSKHVFDVLDPKPLYSFLRHFSVTSYSSKRFFKVLIFKVLIFEVLAWIILLIWLFGYSKFWLLY